MPTKTLEKEPVIAPLKLTLENAVPTPGWGTKLWRGFLSLIVIATAVSFGIIVSFVIALFSGWIPFC